MNVYTQGLKISVIIFLLSLSSISVFGQGKDRQIHLSGLIVAGDSSYGVPGVHLYIKGVGMGTATNHLGYFAMPTEVGDTIIISAIGFKKQHLIIPRRDDQGFSVLIDLKTDTTYLPIIEIFPYPTEEIFKEAFLALELPENHLYEKMEANLNQQQLTNMAMSLPMTGSESYRNFVNQETYQQANQYFATSFSILNPFAWAEFIKSVKRGDLKKKKK